MLQTEKALSHWLQKTYPQVMWTRMENTCSDGLPDLHGAFQGKECWIELKVKQPILRASQYGWFRQRKEADMHNQYVLCAQGNLLYLAYDMYGSFLLSPNRILLTGPLNIYDAGSKTDRVSLLKALFS